MSQPYGSHYDDIERDSHSVQHHDSKHQPYKSVPTSDDHPITDRVDTKIPNVDSSTVEDGLAESAFDTGSTKTYLYICLCYCGGLFVAIANYLLFDYLHERRPADTIPQGWIQVISVAFVNLSRSLLGASLGIAYIQLLWYKFRRRWTTAKLIDRLLALPWNPLNLLSPITLWTAKLEWIFALFCITLPLLSTVPPGSLKVKEIQSKPFEISVPTINFIARSNNSYKATRDAALYFDRAGPNSVWGVKPTTQRLALDSLTRGEPIMWTNPLPGRNASYNVQFEGPRLECHWNHLNYTIQGKYKGLGIAGDLKDIIDHLHPTTVSSKNTEANMDSQANHSNLNDLNFFQYVGMNEAVPGHGITRDYPLFFAFSLWFRNQSRWVEQEEGSAIDWTTTEVIAETPNDKRRKQSDMSRITCTLGLTNYSVHVEHILGSSPSRLTYRYEDLHFDYPKLFIPLDGIYEKGFEFIDER
ncbi:hypothetical protein BJ508DRAFT_36524 [Ascobolus immersus RN42]|uniref:Uncharacterized protein n=1 Tax=Ascobolus immersus RN42 TaxID=1160509 RepID=A0A3N4IRT5_ASCIM|nr:hypothetical protein BJ508DRAFT_36524 [Ascobolus immersus RN42]